MDKEKFVKGVDEVNEQRKKSKITGPGGEVVQEGETAGERRSASYADRVKRWWNSRLHGTFKSVPPEGAAKVECTVRHRASGKVVVRTEGMRAKKRSAEGVAKARAVSELFSFVRRSKGGKRVHVDLEEFEFSYRTLEV